MFLDFKNNSLASIAENKSHSLYRMLHMQNLKYYLSVVRNE